MSTQQQLNQAKQQLLRAIAKNKVKIAETDGYLKITQGDGLSMRLPLGYNQMVNRVNSFK
jgi:hypothetical protein